MPLRNPLELFDRKSGARFLISAPNPKQRGPFWVNRVGLGDDCGLPLHPPKQTSSAPAGSLAVASSRC